MDARGRPTPRSDLTPSTLAARVKRSLRGLVWGSPFVRRAAGTILRSTRDLALDRAVRRNTRGHRHAWPVDPFAIVSIDPGDVRHALGDDGIKMFTWHKAGAVESGDWDTRFTVFEERRTFRALRHRFVGGGPWSETDLYRDNVDLIERGEVVWGCRTVEQFERRLAKLEDLHRVIGAHGYKSQRELVAEGRPDEHGDHLTFLSARQRRLDEIVVSIGRRGELLFVNQGSQHRLAIAKLLGLPRVPARVLVRHAHWQAFRDRLAAYIDDHLGGALEHALPHPDLTGRATRHDTEAWIRVLDAHRSASTRSFLEVGAPLSGCFAQALAKRGVASSVAALEHGQEPLQQALATTVGMRYALVDWATSTAAPTYDAVLVRADGFSRASGRAAVLDRLASLGRLTGQALFVFGTRAAHDAVCVASQTYEVAELAEALRAEGFVRADVLPGPPEDEGSMVRFGRA